MKSLLTRVLQTRTKRKCVPGWAIIATSTSSILESLKAMKLRFNSSTDFTKPGQLKSLAVEINKYEGEGENTGKLVVVLPEGGEQRSKVLDLCSDIAQEQGFDPLEDFGQRRVFIMLD